MIRAVISMLCLTFLGQAQAGEAVPTAPRFTAKPTVVKAGDKVKIEFAVDRPTDVEVAVLGADGKVVRHLAAGVLGGKNNPPEPLKPGLESSPWSGTAAMTWASLPPAPAC